jgi:hypothetical protein
LVVQSAVFIYANTLGGAMGAYLAGFVLLYSLDVAGAVHYAVFLNAATAMIACFVFRKQN